MANSAIKLRTNPTDPGSAIPLMDVTTNGSDVTGVVDRRPEGRRVVGRLKRVSGLWQVDEPGTRDWTSSGLAITFTVPFRRTPTILIGASFNNAAYSNLSASGVTLPGSTVDGDTVGFSAEL